MRNFVFTCIVGLLFGIANPTIEFIPYFIAVMLISFLHTFFPAKPEKEDTNGQETHH